jgi:hypothetical protein
MFHARTATIIGAILVGAKASAIYPHIPKRFFDLVRAKDGLARMRPKFLNPPANLNIAETTGPVPNQNYTGLIPPPVKPQDVKPKPPMLEWLDENLFGRIDVTGNRTLGLHAFSVSGDRAAYDQATNFGEGGQTFTSDGEMTLSGKKVLGVMSFQTTIQDSRLSDPTTNQFLLEYDRGPWKLSEGDIRGTLVNTNPLTAFAKTLHGTMAEYQAGPWHLKGLYSETKGSPRTITIQGSNSSGPYYLESGKLLSDSLEVQVDGVLQKPGTDYVADVQIGSVTFITKTIPATSTIVATFEAVAPGTSPGILSGVGASYDFGRYGRLGLNLMQQTATGASGDGTLPDTFVFAGPSSTIYMLTQEPDLTRPILVQVGSRILTPGTLVSGVVVGDYAFNPSEHRQLILSPTISGQVNIDTLLVKYFPTITAAVVGDRRVYGVDYSLKLGNGGLVQYAQATGQAMSGASSGTSTARTLNGSYKIGRLNLTGNIKDIPSDYVAIESQGFSRNEKSYALGAEMKFTNLTYGLAYSNAVIANQTQISSTTTDLLNARSTSAKLYTNYNSADGTAWTLSQTRTAGHLIYDSQLDTSDFTGSHAFGKVRLDTGFTYQQGKGPLLNNAGATQIGSVYMDTYHVGLNYVPMPTLSFDTRASVSQIRALGQSNSGNDLTLSSVWRPNNRWHVTASELHSVSGQASVLSGFSNGSGYGYGGNGFSSGALGSGFLGAADGTLDQSSLTVAFKSSNRLSLDGHVSSNRSTGTLSSNSTVHDVGLGSELDLGNFTILNATIDKTSTSFVTSDTSVAGSVDTTSLNFNLAASPKGPWSYQLSLSTLLSGGNSLYNQNSDNYSASLGYRFSKKHQVSVGYISGSFTGFQGQNDRQFVVSYTYTIFRQLGLTTSYRVHTVTNTDPTVTTGAYRAAGFDLTLSYGFHP